MTSIAEADFHKFALERVEQEYEELSENWKQIDSKAHQTTTIAGLFLAATFAFASSSSIGSGADTHIKIGVVALLILLSLTVLFAVICMRVRYASMPTSAEQICKDIELLLSSSNPPIVPDPTNYDRLVKRYVADHVVVNEELERCNESKVVWLQRAQYLLIVGVNLAAILTAVRMFA